MTLEKDLHHAPDKPDEPPAAQVQIETVNGEQRAVGVEVQRTMGGIDNVPTGVREQVSLKEGGEVLMTAGAIHTPQILMLSGLGDAKHLKDVGIKCLADLPGTLLCILRISN